MRRFTSTSTASWWYDAPYSCIHKLNCIDFLYMLKDIELSHKGFLELKQFLIHLTHISYGIPLYSRHHPKHDLLSVIDQVLHMDLHKPSTNNLQGVYMILEQTIDNLQKKLSLGEIEFFSEAIWRDKAFRCVHQVGFEDIHIILDDWSLGRVDADNVFGFAEKLFFVSGCFPEYPEGDIRTALIDILDLLHMGYSYPVMKEDIPAIKRYLTDAQSDPLVAKEEFDCYLDTLDIDARVYYYDIRRPQE